MEKPKLLKPTDITSIELLEEEVEKILLLEDKGVVRVLCASVVANRMSLDPVWLMLVTSSSGGKTELINAISGLSFIHPISDITVNTFMSGQKRAGKETSLLLKMNNGIMAFKDFTSILSKAKEARAEILKQLREIFDGEYVKRTGTGYDPTWRGKIGAIAGATEIVYRHLEEFAAMGDRFVMYNIKQPDRRKMAERQLNNTPYMIEYRLHLKACFENFLGRIINDVEKNDDIELDQETKENLFEIADFATRVRSAVLTDFKTGEIDFIPAIEMPTRVMSQLYTIASAFVAMHRSAGAEKHLAMKLTPFETQLLYKVAFDSIPRTRRDVLIPLAQYTGGLSTSGLAVKLNLPTKSTAKYLAQLNALGVCKRIKKSGPKGDHWEIEEKYRSIILKIEGLKTYDKMLQDDSMDDDDDVAAADEEWARSEEEANKEWDQIP